MPETKRAYLDLHIAVILFGFTAILGELIDLSAIAVVWWRVLFASLSFLVLIKIPKMIRKIGRKQVLIFLAIGILVALHWITFFGSIKISNASISLICLATTSFFTSFLEPLIIRRPFQWYEMFLGIMILPGMILIVNGVDPSYHLGIVVGLCSAILATIFSILNKKYIKKGTPQEITAIELTGVWIFITLIAPFVFMVNPEIQWKPSGLDLFYLIVLALLCTTLAYVLSMRALQHLSAFASNLVVNLEPVYGIILAIVILKEHKDLDYSFYLGVLVIGIAVFSYPYIRKRFQKNEPELG